MTLAKIAKIAKEEKINRFVRVRTWFYTLHNLDL